MEDTSFLTMLRVNSQRWKSLALLGHRVETSRLAAVSGHSAPGAHTASPLTAPTSAGLALLPPSLLPAFAFEKLSKASSLAEKTVFLMAYKSTSVFLQRGRHQRRKESPWHIIRTR